MKLPVGFKGLGAATGMKASGNPDLAVIFSQYPLAWAMTTTQNALKAPFILRNRSRYTSEQPIRAVAINSGFANCLTGDQGFIDNDDFVAIVGTVLNLKAQDVLTASTGVLGQRLPVDIIRENLPKLISQLGDDTGPVAQAIMTTDSGTKQVATNLRSGARIVGIAKGAGMIHPNMATMLSFVMTDASINQQKLRELWPQIVKRSYNQISVDGDMSPNDTAMLLSSGRVYADEEEFAEALLKVCEKLGQKIARDGEGATKLLVVNVKRARNDDEARKAARAVIVSPLVKCAAHGNDPNWGRILSAVGAAGLIYSFGNVSVRIQGDTVYDGGPKPFDVDSLSAKMAAEELVIDIDLAAGEGKSTAWGCDLSPEYVRINSDYHT
ncbi:MAG: bifunctional glutamate N-acetyltransferase/amino-acid acetyltransferase ArgJ [Deinococcales bacterium]